MMDNGLTLADIAAVTKDNDGAFAGNGGGLWIFALLILLFGSNGGFGFGGNNGLAQTDLNLLNAVQNGQRDIESRVQEVGMENNSAIKDAAYNNLSETRSIGDAVAVGFANLQNCCCDVQRSIDRVGYEGAVNTAAINSNIDNKFAAMEKSILEQRISEQAQQISQLQMAQQLCGVPKISTFAWGTYPYNACGCGNI